MEKSRPDLPWSTGEKLHYLPRKKRVSFLNKNKIYNRVLNLCSDTLVAIHHEVLTIVLPLNDNKQLLAIVADISHCVMYSLAIVECY